MNDFEGKVIFKVKLGDEIKKLVIHNDDLTYNEVVLMIQRIFSLNTNDEFTIKYTDEDNDLITIANDMDVLLAIQSCKILKLTLFMKNELNKTDETQNKVDTNGILKELNTIRDSIDRFVNKMEVLVKLQQQQQPQQLNGQIAQQELTNEQKFNIENHKEFDPLGKTIKEQRAETPDSIASGVGFKQQQQLQQQLQPTMPSYQAQNQASYNQQPPSLVTSTTPSNLQQFQRPPPQSSLPPSQHQFQQYQQQQPQMMQPPQQNQFSMQPTPSQQSMYQQQHQQQPPATQPPQQQQQNYSYYGAPPPQMQMPPTSGTNPYARSAQSQNDLQRPPSSLYQQAYK